MALKPISIGSALLLGTLLIGCSPTDPVPTGDTTPPTVSLSAALAAVAQGASTTLTATATDNVAVTKVEFYNGTTKISEDDTAPYTAVVTVAGTTTYNAVAYDAAGNKGAATTSVNVAAGTGLVQGTVVDQNIGAPVAGSTITVMQGSTNLGTFTSGADGSFTLAGLPAGSYDLKARKAGHAGSDLYGVVVSDGAATSVSLVQRPAFDTSATTNPATLILTRGDGSTPLAGATFDASTGIDFKVVSAPDSDHVGPVRRVFVQLGRTPGTPGVTSSTTAAAYTFDPQQNMPKVVDSGPVTVGTATSVPNFTAGFGSAAGETVYLTVMSVDYNYNYSRYVVPIKLINTSATAANTVEAPTRAAATAYTLKQEGSWTTPFSTPTPDAAPSGSGVFVEVRWCYTNVTATAKPFAFEIERSSDGTTFTKIGTVGGNSSATCSATNQQTRPFNFRDTSADLTVGKTFTYRVLARGANSVASNTTQTTPLAQFTPTFIGPADESTGVSITPTFVMGQNQTAIGADGAGYNLRLRDLMTLSGYNLPGASASALIRVEEGTGATGNGIPAGDSLVFLSSGSLLGKPAAGSVLTDTSGTYDATKPNLFPVNTAAHTVSIPLVELTGAPLQTLRPYKWEMYSGFAYKYAPAEGNRISAYSVYTWADGTVAPINQTRPVNLNWDFITGEK
ncbi:carboxypeptidase-like regulatory domain-containing protein [Deinococcus sp. QL22]|uniref:carboxypeptidase-like regulatory domain-containing protein n=1 Tax=Deinococcus sp. QL22 TaxID=2939437 RepID=UPI0020182327|nr:carboxypeptidase-like regulatory domain-containing protein [Deinococcus sp. QL22]UQN06810.1 carboxypeptidase-like regulatory domain-containing protein [Deinococcus sp. QL22]